MPPQCVFFSTYFCLLLIVAPVMTVPSKSLVEKNPAPNLATLQIFFKTRVFLHIHITILT